MAKPDKEGTSKPSTAEAYDKAQANDTKAQQQVYGEESARLEKAARAHPSMPGMQSRHDPEDAVGTMWVNVLEKNLTSWFRPRRPGAWRKLLRQKLAWTIRDMRRREERIKRSPNAPQLSLDGKARTGTSRSLGESLAAEQSTPSENAYRTELMEALRQAEEILNQRELAVWQLRQYKQLAYSEIAAEIGETEAQVRPLFHRARGKVVKVLADLGFQESDTR